MSIDAVKQQYPFSQGTQKDLQDYQMYLQLRDEDIAAIEARVFPVQQGGLEGYLTALFRQEQEQQAELKRQQEEERIRQEQQRQKEASQPKSSPVIQTQSFQFPTATIIGLTKSGFLGLGKKAEINSSRGRGELFTENLGNGVTLDMVAIPGGSFLMGSPENEPERNESESPQHKVIVEPFFMGKFPVTQAQWRVVAGFSKVKIDLKPEPSDFKGANRPVEQVSWHDAVEFCARLSKKTGRLYRLPSEAEWEYACRGGTTTPFYFGDTITTDLANYDGNYTYNSSPKGEYRGQTTDVGKFPANPFGLFDMCGNVWEWCQDEWHKNYNQAPNDGTTWKDGDNTSRLLRGGSWYNSPKLCRCACRGRYAPDGRNVSLGFRLACSPARTP